MKIAIYTDNFYPEVSGITDSLLMLGKELSALGQKVYYFAPKYSARDFAKSKVEPIEITIGPYMEVIRYKSLSYRSSPTGQSRIVLPTLWRFWQVKKFGIDVIHTNSFFGMGIEALLAAKFLKIPIVGTNHTPIREFVRYSPVKLPGLENLSVKFLNWYYNQCAVVTAPSGYMLDAMKAEGLKSPGQVVSNPLDTKGFAPPEAAVKIELKKKYDFSINTLLYTGRLAPEKNIDVIIKAIAIVRKEVPDIRFVVTGHGSAESDLKKLAAELGVGDAVRFMGFVPWEEIPLIYQAADMFAIMSTAETQCLSMMQAMATGLPVIAAKAGALPEYVNGDRGFVVEPGNHAELAKKIIILCRDENLKNTFGQAGHEFTKTISAYNIARQWTRIYEDVKNKFKK